MRSPARFLIQSFFIIFLTCLSISAIAGNQPPNPGGSPTGGGPPVGGGAPVGNGVYILITAAVAYGSFKVIRAKQNTSAAS